MARSPLLVESVRLRFRDVVASDIERLYEIFRGNPEFLMLRDDISDGGGGYDLASVARYYESAMLDPARYLLVIVDKATDAAVGLVDFVEESPADGRPWIGLVVIHRSVQRQGLGSEAVKAVLGALGSAGHPAAHMAVMQANASGVAFAESTGFVAYGAATVPTSQGTQHVVLMEKVLPPNADPPVEAT